MTIERDNKGRFVKGGTKNPKAYTWKKGEPQLKKANRKGLNKKNNKSILRQSEKIKELHTKGKYNNSYNYNLPYKEKEKHWNWNGGVTPINEKIRKSKEYNLWRKAVFERDNWTCIWCGQVGGKLNADHIKPFSLFPELRFAIDNGRTLCISCHRKTDTYGGNSKK